MLDTGELRRLATSGRLLIDCDGRPIDLAVDEDAAVPGLLVGPITEAVKQIDAGTVVHHLSRDTMWVVEGFLLDQELLGHLPDGIESAAELIEAIRAAGHEWHLTPSGSTEVL